MASNTNGSRSKDQDPNAGQATQKTTTVCDVSTVDYNAQDSDESPPERPNMLTLALGYAERGWRVFPIHPMNADFECTCRRGALCDKPGKHPGIKAWPINATTDSGQIEQWWTERPLANIGIATGKGSNLLLLDADGPAGRESLAERAVPLTPQVTSGRVDGGTHYYFQCPNDFDARNFAGEVPGLDARANGGYIVAPGSLHASGDRYEWVEGTENLPLAEPPTWFTKILRDRESRKTSDDAPALRGWDKAVELAAGVEDGSRDDAAVSLAGTLHSLRVSKPAAYMWLDVFVKNTARKYTGDKPFTIQNGRDKVDYVWASYTSTVSDDNLRQPIAIKSLADVLTQPPQQFVIQDWLVEKSTAVLFGESSSYKTFNALDMAFCVAAGRDWHDNEVAQGRVLYVAAEGTYGLRKRARGLLQHRQLGDRIPIDVIDRPVSLYEPESMLELLSAIEGEKYALIVIDTLSKNSVGAEENSNSDMTKVANHAQVLAERTGACVLMIHHVTKGNGGMRGASSILNSVDTAIKAVRDANGCVQLSFDKQKDFSAEVTVELKYQVVNVGNEETTLVFEVTDQFKAPTPTAKVAKVKEPAHMKSLWVLAQLVQELKKGLAHGEWCDAITQQASASATTAKNHVRALVKANLVVKDEAGVYTLTTEGQLKAAAHFERMSSD